MEKAKCCLHDISKRKEKWRVQKKKPCVVPDICSLFLNIKKCQHLSASVIKLSETKVQKQGAIFTVLILGKFENKLTASCYFMPWNNKFDIEPGDKSIIFLWVTFALHCSSPKQVQGLSCMKTKKLVCEVNKYSVLLIHELGKSAPAFRSLSQRCCHSKMLQG